MDESRQRLVGETIFVVLLLAMSLFLLFTAYKISGFKSLSSAGAYPMAATTTMLVSGLVILRNTLRSGDAPGLAGESAAQRFARQITPMVVVLFTGSIILYMLLLEKIGFVISSFLFLMVSMRVLGSRNWRTNLFATIVTIIGIYVIFRSAFSVVLPQGDILKHMVSGTPYARWLP
jgi:putative tricarboxylic transport membrane protein